MCIRDSGRVGEWLNECKGLRKVYLDKVNVGVPIMKLALQRLIYQSHESIQVLKFENDARYPHALDEEFFNRCIRGCENLKELVLIWRLNRTMEHERALDFKHGVFKIIDNMPDLEILRIEMPQIVGDKGQEYKKENGEFRYSIVILDLKLRFFYEKTMFTPYMPQVLKSYEESKTRKVFSFNGELMYRKEECAVHETQSSEEEEDDDEKENEEDDETSCTEEERLKQEENEEKRLKTLKNWW